MSFFIGIEGGATKSSGVLVDGKNGEILKEITGGPANVRTEDLSTVISRLEKIMKFLYMSSSSDVPITGKVSLGLTLAGASQEDIQAKIAVEIKQRVKFIDRIIINTDAVAPVFMSQKKGTVLICGTGSSCLFVTEDGIQKRSGGLGHMLGIGDEGSAFWIATKAIKSVLDKADGIPNNVLDTTLIEAEIKSYFKIEDLKELIKIYQENFDKGKIAGFTAKLAAIAKEKDDPVAKICFASAGGELAKLVVSMEDTLEIGEEEPPEILCQGSVWNSWELLKESFIQGMKLHSKLTALSLVRVSVSCAYGAARFASIKLTDAPLDSKLTFNLIETVQIQRESPVL
ncbi:Oidioi.mRNA.OKI2018_I69.chr1.g883.t1.cds [Oikopleura dioica]|uniref:N-acetyl-D-glucosamine kinase n=1 Tax=Oikopleura dioica TaxID=34765 RepID=A0ABN7SN09_OIKDI|nr:Oidioi.mRNA.OKI2018_I69.chr1.g883.t1.cds [Oikopleura dioica]